MSELPYMDLSQENLDFCQFPFKSTGNKEANDFEVFLDDIFNSPLVSFNDFQDPLLLDINAEIKDKKEEEGEEVSIRKCMISPAEHTSLLRKVYTKHHSCFRSIPKRDQNRINNIPIFLSEKTLRLLKIHDRLFNPHDIGLVPQRFWSKYNMDISITEFMNMNLQSRRNRHSRFEYRIYNILRLTLLNPELVLILGASWISDTVFWVTKNILADALNVTRCANGALFHRQGNFPCHGFIECKPVGQNEYEPIEPGYIRKKHDLIYFTHEHFCPDMDDSDFDRIRYQNLFKKNYKHRY